MFVRGEKGRDDVINESQLKVHESSEPKEDQLRADVIVVLRHCGVDLLIFRRPSDSLRFKTDSTMGKKSKRSSYEVQVAKYDALGNKLIDEGNASKTKTEESKPADKSKHDDISERRNSNSSDKRQKTKNQEYNVESSKTRPDQESDEWQNPDRGRKTTRDKSAESLREKSSEKHSRKEEYDPYDYRHYENPKGKDYKSKKDHRQNPVLLRINEITGNLFDAPETSSLAHCVAEDLQMGAGIAVEFRDRFKKTGYLADLNVKTGGVAVLVNNNRFIYYLITKRLSKGKPTMDSLRKSLLEMAKHIEKNKVKELAMPKIGSGLDRLDWDLVLDTIRTVFCYIDVEITIYHYDGTLSKTEVATKKTPFVKHIDLETEAVDSGTAFLYLSNTDGYETPEMRFLDSRRPYLREFKLQRKIMGKVVRIESRAVSECVYGLICKVDNKILFQELENCLAALRSIVHKDEYTNIAILGSRSDNLDMHHILTLLKHYISPYITIWVYWKGQIPEDFNNPSMSAM